jgi:lecithin-cholesterol acyltransferase
MQRGAGVRSLRAMTSTTAFRLAILAVALAAAPALAGPSAASASGRTPIVFFPGYGATRLRVVVADQSAAPGCPRSGTFEDGIGTAAPAAFTQTCSDRLLTLRYDRDGRKPMARRFSAQLGVRVKVAAYGATASAPLYGALYSNLESAGYVRDRDIRVAGYNWRLTPDMDGFLARTKRLVERTYRANGDRPVQLVGHSNGPLYAQYLLTHSSRAWKDTYVHGFTPIAGNLPGQGSSYLPIFTGLNVADFSFPANAENARTSARLWRSSPASYMSASDPDVFGDRETVVEDASTGRRYTPEDYRRLLADAGLRRAREIADHYIGFVRFRDRAHFPNVDVYAERGSGLPTLVGAVLPSLKRGQVLDLASAQLFTRDGDSNQEDITNKAVRAWRAMRCYRFRFRDNPGVDHVSLALSPVIARRLVADAARPRSRCG